MPDKVEEMAEGAKQGLTLVLDPAVKTLFADKMQLMVRSDGMAVLRWLQECPEFHSEAARIIVTQEHLRKIIDLLCKNTGHYPTPEDSKKA